MTRTSSSDSKKKINKNKTLLTYKTLSQQVSQNDSVDAVLDEHNMKMNEKFQ